jgi:hypothetical protein
MGARPPGAASSARTPACATSSTTWRGSANPYDRALAWYHRVGR